MELTLRAAGPSDREFLLAVYASTRAAELAATGWDADTVSTFLEMQFTAQEADRARRHPDSRRWIVSCDGTDIGRLELAALPDEERLVEIALLPAWRGRGIGSRLLERVIADAGSRIVSLHVAADNPAIALYDRFGFTVVARDELTLRMERASVEDRFVAREAVGLGAARHDEQLEGSEGSMLEGVGALRQRDVGG